jgi:hypothetical protein
MIDWWSVIWMTVASIGVLISAVALQDARHDAAILRAARVDGAKRILVVGHIRRETMRLIVQVCFLFAGVLVLLPGLGYRLRTGFLSEEETIKLLIVVPAALIVLNSIEDMRARQRLLNMLK